MQFVSATATRCVAYLPQQATLRAFTQGVQYGSQVAIGNMQDRTTRAGASMDLLTALFQTLALEAARNLTMLALEAALRGPVHVFVRITTGSIVLLAPLTIEMLLQAKKIDALARQKLGADHWFVKITASVAKATTSKQGQRILLGIHDHLSHVTQVASVVASVALITLGNPAVGAVALAFTLTDIACEHGLLPTRVRRLFNGALSYTFAMASLLVGTLFERLRTVAFLVAECVMRFFEHHYRKPPVEAATPIEMGLDQLKTPGKLPLEVQRQHVNSVYALPPEPNLDLKAALADFNSAIDWQAPEVQAQIQKYLAGDEKYEKSGDEKWQKCLVTGAKVINIDGKWEAVADTTVSRTAYIQWGLTQFGNHIVDESILEGEPKDYAVLRNQAKQLVLLLQSLDTKLQKNDLTEAERATCYAQKLHCLIDLAASSYYCGAGIIRAVQENYAGLCNGIERTTLQGKINVQLSNLRRTLFDQWYHNSVEILKILMPQLQMFIEFQDTHTYNMMLTTAGDEFGLPLHAGAMNDHTVNDSAVSRGINKLTRRAQYWVYSKMFSDMPELLEVYSQFYKPQETLWKQYTPQEIIRAVRIAIREDAIPSVQLSDWWYNWIQRELLKTDQPLAKAAQEKIDHQLALLDTARKENDIVGIEAATQAIDAAKLELHDLVTEAYFDDETQALLIHQGDTVYEQIEESFVTQLVSGSNRAEKVDYPVCKKNEYTDRALEIMLTEMGVFKLSTAS